MESPSTPAATEGSNQTDSLPRSKRPIFQRETTGNFWGDVREAFNRLSVKDDLARINEIPCARNSLLSGIASGVGIGFVRGMSTSVFVASNWAVGSFLLISFGTWTICRKSREDERKRVQQVVEQIPRRFVKPNSEDSSPSQLTS